jgi:UDP-3-O-[3-hydroxymyristoyl] glucosamine N-acyltransferase
MIDGAAPIDAAGPGQISFVANPRYLHHLKNTKAAALVLDKTTPCSGPAVLRHDDPYLTFAHVLDLLYPDPILVEPGIHERAVVDEGAEIDSTAAIGPLCHIRPGARIGRNTQLVSGVFVGDDVVIGESCLLYPGVQIQHGCRIGNNVIIHSSTVIGSDGFGFAPGPSGLKKVRQVGWVEIGDEVEIGSNTSVDRGALGPTRIGRGTKIDNLVQVAHNVEIGQHSVIVSQVGISGSTKIGNGVQLGGQVGIVGHIEIGDGARVGAQSGVSGNITPGHTVLGSPARDIKGVRRLYAALPRLPEMLRRLRKIEKKLEE